MVGSSKSLDALKTIGLNKYERALWVALLSRGASTAGELSDISNVPRSRCYDVLESLADKGFVVIQHGKPIRYIAVSPKEAFERAKKALERRTEDMKKRIDRIKRSDVLRELDSIYKKGMKLTKPEDLSGALKGRDVMHQHIESMFKKAKKSIKLITSEKSLETLADRHLNHLKKAAERGVRIQIAAPARNKDVVDRLSVEHVEKMLGRVFIVDGQEVVVGLTDDSKIHPSQDVAFWSRSGHATENIFEPLFNMVWHHSKPAK
jgi:sugar-specific transcriptional regulator TrmB